MLGLRARAAAQLPCPSPSPSSAPTRFARLTPLAALSALGPPASAPPPARAGAPSPASLSARWGGTMRPGGAATNFRPTTRVFCTAASSSQREGKELLVQHLLVGEKDVRLLVDLEKNIITGGADLSDLAVQHSLCPSKENGGMLGWVRRGQMAPVLNLPRDVGSGGGIIPGLALPPHAERPLEPRSPGTSGLSPVYATKVPEFEEAAFGAPLNKVVRCKTKFGWHLLQVLAERDQCVLQDIDPEELHTKMQDPSFLEEAQLIDVREPDEVAKASLPGFKVLPLRQFGTWGPVMTDEFNPQKDTYVLCHHGMRSMQVAKWLQSQGFKKVYNVAGGIHAYAVKADSSVPTY
ncbi:unnamed protein product [Urochloa humidicola]